ncbi:hypothetical protein, partial [Planktothrix sp.]
QKLFIKILQTTILEDEFSYNTLNILMDLEEEFDEINESEIENLKTVRDFVEFIYTKIVS